MVQPGTNYFCSPLSLPHRMHSQQKLRWQSMSQISHLHPKLADLRIPILYSYAKLSSWQVLPEAQTTTKPYHQTKHMSNRCSTPTCHQELYWQVYRPQESHLRIEWTQNGSALLANSLLQSTECMAEQSTWREDTRRGCQAREKGGGGSMSCEAHRCRLLYKQLHWDQRNLLKYQQQYHGLKGSCACWLPVHQYQAMHCC